MNKTLSLFALLLITATGFAQEMYTKTFGSPKNSPLIFLHGGPGYNSASFEATTAQKLADSGFYVIVYDRRGEGRSVDANAKFTFEQTFADLNAIYTNQKLTQATLIGHSFGGIVATLFTEKYPEKVNAIVLVGAPVSLQQSFRTIIDSSRKIYTEKNDQTSLNYLKMLEAMDPSSMEYASYCFMNAMQNGFYSPKNKTDEAKAISAEFKNHPDYKYASQMTQQAPSAFAKNENYTTIDLSETLKKLAPKTKIYGLYGKEDGLYAPEQITDLSAIIGKNNLLYLDNCSHSVFIDQQTQFISALKHWIK